jgi:hypothetical protein
MYQSKKKKKMSEDLIICARVNSPPLLTQTTGVEAKMRRKEVGIEVIDKCVSIDCSRYLKRIILEARGNEVLCASRRDK